MLGCRKLLVGPGDLFLSSFANPLRNAEHHHKLAKIHQAKVVQFDKQFLWYNIPLYCCWSEYSDKFVWRNFIECTEICSQATYFAPSGNMAWWKIVWVWDIYFQGEPFEGRELSRWDTLLTIEIMKTEEPFNAHDQTQCSSILLNTSYTDKCQLCNSRISKIHSKIEILPTVASKRGMKKHLKIDAVLELCCIIIPELML